MTDPLPRSIWSRLSPDVIDEERAVLEAAPIPLDPAFKARLVEAALAVPAVKPLPATPAPVVDELAARRARRRTFSWPWLGAAASAAAVAAALLLVPLGFDRDPLPSYRVAASGRPSTLGSEPAAAPVQLVPGARLTVDLQPSKPGKNLVARGYVRRGGAPIRAPHLDPIGTPAGRFHLSLPVEQIPEITPDTDEILFVIGPPSKLPSDAALADLVARGAEPDGFRLTRYAIHVERR